MGTKSKCTNGRINHFCANIEVILANRNLRMIDLARDLEIASSTLRDMVNRGRPRESTLRRVAEALSVGVEDLVKTVTPAEYGTAIMPRIG